MEMTISEYCDKKKCGKRYLQRLLQNNKIDKLVTDFGIKSFKKYGHTYVLTIPNDYFKESE